MAYDLELMTNIAYLYYKKNLTQESIARRLNVSKYKVNRALKRAIQEGIVQIKIKSKEKIFTQKEGKICERQN